MKELKIPKWKTKKKLGFRLYFTIYVSVIICVSVAGAVLFADATNGFWVGKLNIPEFLIVFIMSLVVGFIFARFVAEFTLSPIKKVQEAMNEVSQGNLYVTIDEECDFDEIEDICHAFNIMTKELRATEIIQTDFVSNVSHEFKTPLTAIEGYTTMLQDGALTDEERLEYTNKILFNTRRMSELVQNILLISKLDNQGIEDKKEKFSLDEQIRLEILAAEPKWTEKDIDFDVKLDSVTYNGNKTLFSHVWGNLLGNAIKFSPIGGKITIELTMQNGCVCFCVSDEGEGIKEEDKKHIFNKFYQSDASHKQEGNGLGLALVKKIVDMYGGEIQAENLQPQGCRFTVLLPTK